MTGTKGIICMLPKYIIIHCFRPPLVKKILWCWPKTIIFHFPKISHFWLFQGIWRSNWNSKLGFKVCLIHNTCPSSEKEHEKCIFRLSYFHRIQPNYDVRGWRGAGALWCTGEGDNCSQCPPRSVSPAAWWRWCYLSRIKQSQLKMAASCTENLSGHGTPAQVNCHPDGWRY